jgi:hypothetical protein
MFYFCKNFKQKNSMQKCKNCQGILLPGAHFCHKCGAKNSEDLENSPNEISSDETKIENISTPKQQTVIDFEIVDTTSNSSDADFFFFHEEKNEDTELISNNEIPSIEATKEEDSSPKSKKIDILDFKALFFNALHQRVSEEHNAKQYSDFVEIFYRKKFLETLTQRYNWFLDEMLMLEKKMPLPEKPQQRLLVQTIENLVDYYIYTHCEKMEDVFPHQVILKYADAQIGEIRNSTFFNDFLQINEENLLIYKDFISMPQEKLKNAFQSFLFTEREELVFFICDLSITGTGKEGFAVSNKRMYWRMPLGKPHSVSFDNIKNIKIEKEWLEINGLFFNINRSLNKKLLRMLKKIKLIYG